MEERVVIVEGRKYSLRGWSPADGQPWAFRLLKLSFAAQLADPSDGAAVSDVLALISEKDFIEFREVVLKYTDLLDTAEDGEELVVDLLKNRGRLEGRYADLFLIMAGHLEHEFSPFLLSLRRELEGKAAAKKAKATAR